MWKQDELLKDGDAIIVDVGGGSTELVLAQKAVCTFAQQLSSWLAAHARDAGELFAPAERVRTILDQHINRIGHQLHRNVPVDKVRYMVAISGDAQFAASLLSPQVG